MLLTVGFVFNMIYMNSTVVEATQLRSQDQSKLHDHVLCKVYNCICCERLTSSQLTHKQPKFGDSMRICV